MKHYYLVKTTMYEFLDDQCLICFDDGMRIDHLAFIVQYFHRDFNDYAINISAIDEESALTIRENYCCGYRQLRTVVDADITFLVYDHDFVNHPQMVLSRDGDFYEITGTEITRNKYVITKNGTVLIRL